MAALRPALLVLPADAAEAASAVDVVWSERDYRARVPLRDLAQVLGRRAVILVVPARLSVLARVAIPARSPEQAARALPWAVEDALLGPPEAYQVGLGPMDGADWWVAWVARDWLSAWSERLRQLGLRVLAWMPEAALLPAVAGDWLLLHRHADWLLQTAAGSAVVMNEDVLPTSLALLALGVTARPRLRVYAAPEDRRRLMQVLKSEGWPVAEDLQGDFPSLARAALLAHVPAWQLPLPGSGHADHESRTRRRVLRRLAAGLAAYALAALGLYTLDSSGAHALAARRAEAEALVRASFPEQSRVLQPLAQMQQGLQQLRRKAGLQAALSLLGPRLRATPALRLQTLEYTPEVWRLHILAPDLLTLDGFAEALGRELPSHRVRLESAGPVAQEFAAWVRLERSTP